MSSPDQYNTRCHTHAGSSVFKVQSSYNNKSIAGDYNDWQYLGLLLTSNPISPNENPCENIFVIYLFPFMKKYNIHYIILDKLLA